MTVAESDERDQRGATGTTLSPTADRFETAPATAAPTAHPPAPPAVTTSGPAPGSPPGSPPGPAEPADLTAAFAVPRLSAGLEVLGEYLGSGSKERKYLVRRGDGQVVQLSRLLHQVVSSIDGERNTETIAHRVSARCAREISPENVRYLIEEKLQPLGVTVPFGQSDDQAANPRSDLLLALKGHRVMLRERQVDRIARSLAWLHLPPVVVVMLSAAVAMDTWLFAFHGAMTPVLDMLDQPVLLLVVFGLTVASLVFHEFGHASACRYGGAQPGCIGCGLFLIWPSMYTDVTDVYRLGRSGRLRTDLGGVYFNVVFMVALFGGYLGTGQSFFLSAIYLAHFEILEQLTPVVRLDGYYILGDLAGVPDLYGKVKPILLGMLPRRPVPPEVADLRPSARTIVTTWVVAMVPLMAAELGYVLWNLPRLLVTALRSMGRQLQGTVTAFTDGQIASGLIGVIGVFMLLCPLAGAAYLSVRVGGRLARAADRAAKDSPRLRVALWAATLSSAVVLGAAWIGGLTPRPLPPQPPVAPLLQPHLPAATRAHPSTSPTPSPSTEPATTSAGAGGPAPTTSPVASPTTVPPSATATTPTATPTSAATTTTPPPTTTGTSSPTPSHSRTPTPTPTRPTSPPPTSATPTPTRTTPTPTGHPTPSPTDSATGAQPSP
jgi:putative peptide zinc metalloprotease protein